MAWIIGIILLSGFSGYAETAEELFIKGNACRFRGQDSLASIYYEEAYLKDSNSIVLQEILGKIFIESKRYNKGLKLLRNVAYFYVKQKDWLKAVLIFRELYIITRSYDDGSMMALMLFNNGIENDNALNIKGANEIWEGLINRALMKNMPSRAIQLMEGQILAYKNALKIVSNKNHIQYRYYIPVGNAFIRINENLSLNSN